MFIQMIIKRKSIYLLVVFKHVKYVQEQQNQNKRLIVLTEEINYKTLCLCIRHRYIYSKYCE